jgi:predicted hotdog family 3-hydroxylacyl-ACP dehydratase
MCLLDSVIEWTAEQIRCETLTHRDPENPLRRLGQVAALHLTEYGAQAMAAHGALIARGGPQAGMLGVLRDIKLHVGRIDDIPDTLVVTATRRLARADGLIYDFAVTLRDSPTRTLCDGRISVVLQAS